MKRTLIGIVTFGNVEFTKLCVRSIRETTTKKVEFLIVVGKPDDQATKDWLDTEPDINSIAHSINRGFPASLNDIYDFAWNGKGIIDYDYVIIAGNDTVAYPGAVDAMIHEAETSDMEWIGASQFDARSLVERYPEVANLFEGPRCIFTDFTKRPWEAHKGIRPYGVECGVIKDVHNFCLFKKSVLEKIGYVDANFYPAYFSDNDYCRRATLSGLKTCNLDHAAYFHFWSRTIHQGSGGSNDRFFNANERFYVQKWGATPQAGEKFTEPFNGAPYALTFPGGRQVRCPGGIKIDDRAYEGGAVSYWREHA